MDQWEVAIASDAREADLRREMKKIRPLTHPRLKEIYKTGVREKEGLTRRQMVSLARFRA